jgi:anti-sigma28 factor (negative regulator of flagellin synthesis)
VKTQKERSEERRQEKLAAMKDQIEQGTLKVRKMTKEEKAALPPRPVAPKRRPR